MIKFYLDISFASFCVLYCYKNIPNDLRSFRKCHSLAPPAHWDTWLELTGDHPTWRLRCNSLHLRETNNMRFNMLDSYLPGLSRSLPSLFLSLWITERPAGLAGKQLRWAHSGNNSQSICALDRHADSFKYCPQPLLHFSVSIIIRISLLRRSFDLPKLPAFTVSFGVFFFAQSLISVSPASLFHFPIILFWS